MHSYERRGLSYGSPSWPDSYGGRIACSPRCMSFSRDSGGEPLLHRWLDNWNGIGLIAAGMHYQGMRLSLSHIADGEWRCVFMGDTPRLARPRATGWPRRRGGRCTWPRG